VAKFLCPVWVGYLLVSPVRKLFQNPDRILGPYVQPGMTVLDIGCGMGYFSLPLARRVGSEGKVVCVDLQEPMIRALLRRAGKAGVMDRVDGRVCGPDGLGLADLAGRVDFALAFAVVHEVPDPAAFFADVAAAVKPDGRLLLAEPKGHVSVREFAETVGIAEKFGLLREAEPRIRGSRTALLRRTASET